MHSNAATAPPPQTSKRTLLIVDDEEGPRQSLWIVFRGDYQVLLADDGAKAIELAKQSCVDAAILDIRLSDMSGIELLMRLKEIDPAIEVVMLTAFETPETTRQALRLGACDYLNKPFDIPAMREAVAKAMQRRGFTDQIRANQQQLEQVKLEVRNQLAELETGRARVEIYASILHDINSPLTYISTATELVADRIERCAPLKPEDLKDIHSKLISVQRHASNCSEIARRYLQFLRQRSPENAVVSLRPVLDDLPHLLRAHCRQKLHQVDIEAPPADVRVRINGTDLIQILVNLVKNALQCTPPPQHVEIRSRVLHKSLNWNKFADGPHDRYFNREGFPNTPPILVLSVTDDGPGIPSELISKIFNSFSLTKSESQGTGIGLKIVQRLMQEAHGALHLHSQPGQGTQFTLFLMAAPHPPLIGGAWVYSPAKM